MENFLSKKLTFEMGHRVPNHNSKCANPHGHSYTLEVAVGGDVITEKNVSEEGMIIDFSDVKNIVKTFIDAQLDHAFMAHDSDVEIIELFQAKGWKVLVVDFIPTAENIAKYLYEQLRPKFQHKYEINLQLVSITLKETETSTVIYLPKQVAHTFQKQV